MWSAILKIVEYRIRNKNCQHHQNKKTWILEDPVSTHRETALFSSWLQKKTVATFLHRKIFYESSSTFQPVGNVTSPDGQFEEP